MDNDTIISAMAKYINENKINHEKILQFNTCWMTVQEWSDVTGLKLSVSKMTALHKAGLVVRVKNKEHYGDDVFHYWPAVLSINAF